MSQDAKTMDGQGWALLLFLSVLWGGAFFFAGVAVKELPPLTVVLARVSLAAITLLPIFWYYGHTLPRSLSGWLPFIGMGLLNNALPFGLIFFRSDTNNGRPILHHQCLDAPVHGRRHGCISRGTSERSSSARCVAGRGRCRNFTRD